MGMKCEKVLGNLSSFIDEMLEESLALSISQHLRECPGCENERLRIAKQRNALRSLKPVMAPDYMYDLVQIRIKQSHRQTWTHSLGSLLEYRLSKIRSTEGIWYLTRLMGTVSTLILFVAISSAIHPLYLRFASPLPPQVYYNHPLPSQQLVYNMQKAFGMPEAHQKPVRSSEAKLNDLYLYNLSQSVARTHGDDTISIVTRVDRNGAAKVQNILEYPADDSLLSDVTEMISSAGWRPATQNGRAVESWQVLIFSKICVYN
jgi:hypothetical protein